MPKLSTSLKALIGRLIKMETVILLQLGGMAWPLGAIFMIFAYEDLTGWPQFLTLGVALMFILAGLETFRLAVKAGKKEQFILQEKNNAVIALLAAMAVKLGVDKKELNEFMEALRHDRDSGPKR